jgi:hypothetical protein
MHARNSIALSALVFLAAAAAMAEPKVKAGKGASPSPKQAIVYVNREDDDGAVFPKPFEEGLVDRSVARYGWTKFSVDSKGMVELTGDSSFSGLRKSGRPVAGARGLYAAEIEFMGAGATGGKAYAVSFKRDDLGFFQPDDLALILAIEASKKRSGEARVVKTAFSKGAFSYSIAVK